MKHLSFCYMFFAVCKKIFKTFIRARKESEKKEEKEAMKTKSKITDLNHNITNITLKTKVQLQQFGRQVVLQLLLSPACLLALLQYIS